MKDHYPFPDRHTPGSPILSVSIAKSGTHLLAKALSGMPGIRHSGYHMDRETIAGFVDKGVDYPVRGVYDITTNLQAEFIWIERLLKSIPPHHFLTAHVIYNPIIHNALKRMKYKVLLMVRDPRDVVLSWAEFMGKERNHLLFSFFSSKDLNCRITCGIKGITSDVTGTISQAPINRLMRSRLKWTTEGDAFLVKFEDLIGENGRGDRDAQRNLLRNIAQFLDIDCKDEDIHSLCGSLYGDTYTFNRGVAGRWQEVFSEEQKALFKAQTGQLLIEMGYEQDQDW